MRAVQQSVREETKASFSEGMSLIIPTVTSGHEYGPAASRDEPGPQHTPPDRTVTPTADRNFHPKANALEGREPDQENSRAWQLTEWLLLRSDVKKSERTPTRLSLPAEREGNLTKLRKKNNSKPITINKGIVTLKLAMGRQKRVATTGPKWKPQIRKLKNPKGKKGKRSEKESGQENEDTQK